MSNLEKLKILIGEEATGQEQLLNLLLTIAAEKILERLYPYNHDKKTVPQKYANKQVEIALFLFNKRGAEGEVSHSENGISRTYSGADVPSDLLSGITPYVGVS